MKEKEDALRDEFAAKKRDLELQSRKCVSAGCFCIGYSSSLRQVCRVVAPSTGACIWNVTNSICIQCHVFSEAVFHDYTASSCSEREPTTKTSTVRLYSQLNLSGLFSCRSAHAQTDHFISAFAFSHSFVPCCEFSLDSLASPPPPRPVAVVHPPCASSSSFSFGPQMPLPAIEGGSPLDDAVQRRLVELACMQTDTVRLERKLAHRAAARASASAGTGSGAAAASVYGAGAGGTVSGGGISGGAFGAGGGGTAVTAVLPTVGKEKEKKKTTTGTKKVRTQYRCVVCPGSWLHCPCLFAFSVLTLCAGEENRDEKSQKAC